MAGLVTVFPKAIALSKNYQTITDLEKAQSLARTADGQIATENRAELNNAKQQLQSARLELEEIPPKLSFLIMLKH